MKKPAQLIIEDQASIIESKSQYGFSLEEIKAHLGGEIQQSFKEDCKYYFTSNNKTLAIGLDGLCFCWSGGHKTC
jgi:hypothetical protein